MEKKTRIRCNGFLGLFLYFDKEEKKLLYDVPFNFGKKSGERSAKVLGSWEKSHCSNQLARHTFHVISCNREEGIFDGEGIQELFCREKGSFYRIF